LPPILPNETEKNIQSSITMRNTSIPYWNLEGLNYFWGDTPSICYLVSTAKNELEELNSQFKVMLPEFWGVLENTYPVFIPHITLFKIRNLEKFLTQKSEIEDIIHEEIKKLAGVSIFESISLYRVNSHFRPEIQISISLKTYKVWGTYWETINF
jgi:2'-5' RNA ligase